MGYIKVRGDRYDEAKRLRNLVKHRLDFLDAAEVFDGLTVDMPDARKAYGESRTFTIGRLRGRMVAISWTQRGKKRRVISMRKCNEREQKLFRTQV